MQIRIAGKQLEIGESLPARVRSRLSSVIGKYFDRDADANVTFARERSRFRADCVLHLSTGIVLQVSGTGSTAYMAFDAALDRMAKRVRRYKRRLKNHHGRGPSDVAVAE